MPEPKDPFNDDESPLAGHPLYEDMRRAVLIFTALASAGSLENVRTMLSATGSDDLRALALEDVGVEVRRAMREAAELSGRPFIESEWAAWVQAPETTSTLDEFRDAWEAEHYDPAPEVTYDDVLTYLVAQVGNPFRVAVGAREGASNDALAVDLSVEGLLDVVEQDGGPYDDDVAVFAVGAARLALSPNAFRYAVWLESTLILQTAATALYIHPLVP
jgi:hypothetical protein